MKWIKSYQKYKESLVIDLQFSSARELMESLNLWQDAILSSIGAEEIDIFNTFKLPKEQFQNKMDIDYLADNVEFLNSLASIALKKASIQNTDDYETFLNKPCKFMFIYGSESNELENPLYIVFQSWNETTKKWEEAKLYKVNDDIKKFYDKLTSKTIEVVDGDQNYIYTTSNGNEWMLQNTDKENDIFKKYFRKEDFEKLLSDKKAKITII